MTRSVLAALLDRLAEAGLEDLLACSAFVERAHTDPVWVRRLDDAYRELDAEIRRLDRLVEAAEAARRTVSAVEERARRVGLDPLDDHVHRLLKAAYRAGEAASVADHAAGPADVVLLPFTMAAA
jgi:hypothetical protein